MWQNEITVACFCHPANCKSSQTWGQQVEVKKLNRKVFYTMICNQKMRKVSDCAHAQHHATCIFLAGKNLYKKVRVILFMVAAAHFESL